MGDIVGFYANPFAQGFLYSKGKFTTIACNGGNNTGANGINDNGVIVGTCEGLGQGFIYRNGKYTYVAYPKAKATWLGGINNKGEIVGGYFGPGPKYIQHGFVYFNGTFTLLPSSVQGAVGINNNGTIAGYSCSNQVCSGVLLTKGPKGWQVRQKIVYPGAANTFPNGINDNGDLAGYWTPGPNTPGSAFVYLKNTNSFVPLDFGNNNGSIAGGINNSGEIVGEYTIGGGGVINGFYGSLQ